MEWRSNEEYGTGKNTLCDRIKPYTTVGMPKNLKKTNQARHKTNEPKMSGNYEESKKQNEWQGLCSSENSKN